MTVHSIALNSSQVLHTQVLAEHSSDKTVVSITGITDVGVYKTLTTPQNPQNPLLGEVKTRSDMESGKTGEGQFVMAMIASFIGGGGRAAVHGIILGPVEFSLLTLKEVGNDNVVLTILHRSRKQNSNADVLSSYPLPRAEHPLVMRLGLWQRLNRNWMGRISVHISVRT